MEKVEKIEKIEKVEKVVIKGEGKQVLELLLKKYRISKTDLIKLYAEKAGTYDNTMETYLKNRSIDNNKFKKILEKDFGRSYEKVVRTAKDQVIFYIEAMRNAIHLYSEEKDLLNTHKLTKLCQRFDLPYHRLMTVANAGRIKGNIGLYSEASLMLEEVIKEAQELGCQDLYVCFTVDLACIYNDGKKFATARKTLKELETFLKEVNIEDKAILYKYWHTYAMTMLGMRRYAFATGKFKEAYEYAETPKVKLETFLNIARTYRLRKKYDLEMETYQKALKDYKKHLGLKAIVSRHIATAYYENGDIGAAQHNIRVAMNLLHNVKDIDGKVNILESYLLIYGEEEKVLKELINILLDTEKTFENRDGIYRCLDSLIEKLTDMKDLKLLIRLRDQLRLAVKVQETEDDVRELKIRVADVMIYLMGEGV